jgi:TonB family protein
MRVTVCILLLLFSIEVRAGDAQPVLLSFPYIPYPDELREVGKEGDVHAKLSVRSDGTITKVEILESSYPQFAEVAEKTIPKWRYQSWVPTNGKPSEVEVKASFQFRMKDGRKTRSDSNVVLAETKCREVNKAFAEMDETSREYPLIKMRIFWHTEQHLNGPVMRANAPASDIESMNREFRSALPGILDNCRKNPGAKYADYLPEQIKLFL